MSDISSQLPSTVGVVGLGLIGASIGLSLRGSGVKVVGCDASAKHEKIALDRFAVDRISSFEEVVQSDCVFLATPPSTVVGLLGRIKSEAVVTDCASVKGVIAEYAEKQKLTRFVPGHPMAGHEKSGPVYSSAWLFRGAKWLLTPTNCVGSQQVKVVERLVQLMGAVPVELDPNEHDQNVALLSHLPHVIAACLVEMGDKTGRTDAGGGSWRDLTRVGGVDPKLWTQILSGNSKALVEAITELEGLLQHVRSTLETEDSSSLTMFLERAKKLKAKQESQEATPTKARPLNRKRR